MNKWYSSLSSRNRLIAVMPLVYPLMANLLLARFAGCAELRSLFVMFLYIKTYVYTPLSYCFMGKQS